MNYKGPKTLHNRIFLCGNSKYIRVGICISNSSPENQSTMINSSHHQEPGRALPWQNVPVSSYIAQSTVKNLLHPWCPHPLDLASTLLLVELFGTLDHSIRPHLFSVCVSVAVSHQCPFSCFLWAIFTYTWLSHGNSLRAMQLAVLHPGFTFLFPFDICH